MTRWQARHPRAQAVMSLESPRHTNLDETGGEPLGVSNIVKMIKNGCSGACVKCILEAAAQSLDCAIRLRVEICCLFV